MGPSWNHKWHITTKKGMDGRKIISIHKAQNCKLEKTVEMIKNKKVAVIYGMWSCVQWSTVWKEKWISHFKTNVKKAIIENKIE